MFATVGMAGRCLLAIGRCAMHELRVHPLPDAVAPTELAGGTAVVVDLLRASTTICQALASGATEVVPFVTVEEALAAAAGDRANVVLGGERGGRRIEGFDLGNSPREYTPAAVGGRRVLVTTTNGTRALDHARRADRIVVGALVNLSAVAASLGEARRVDIVCAGTDGVESREDILAAGAIAERLTTAGGAPWQLNAAAATALAQWRARGDDLVAELRTTPGGRNLVAIGLDADLADCARIDALAVVPEFDVSAWRIALP